MCKIKLDILKNEWIKFNLENLPKPLNHTSGGWYYVVQNLGIHGKRIQPCWWTGSEFSGVNNTNIIHFKKLEFPNYE